MDNGLFFMWLCELSFMESLFCDVELCVLIGM